MIRASNCNLFEFLKKLYFDCFRIVTLRQFNVQAVCNEAVHVSGSLDCVVDHFDDCVCRPSYDTFSHLFTAMRVGPAVAAATCLDASRSAFSRPHISNLVTLVPQQPRAPASAAPFVQFLRH